LKQNSQGKKLETISSFGQLINKINFDNLRDGLLGIQNLELHLQHLLISEEGLKHHQDKVTKIDSNIGSLVRVIEAKLNQTPRTDPTVNESIASLSQQVEHLHEQITGLTRGLPQLLHSLQLIH
jgi:CII-binding regulator of phage lambda lysogenization HflD